tara:strand:- start:1786 stop:2073 length:288 start_codon:yes stop_codon:yes gene_type:complete
MTYNETIESRYAVRTVKGQADQTGLCLYEAEKALKAAAQSGALLDASRITDRDGRFVAFFCLWEGRIKPAFHATKSERTVIGEDFPIPHLATATR